MQRDTQVPSVLEDVLPANAVERAAQVGATGRERCRRLPRDVTLLGLVGMGLFRDLSVSNVVGQALIGLGARVSWAANACPHATSITQARDRLGVEPVRELFRQQSRDQTQRFAAAATWRGLVVSTIDGSVMRVADTLENDSAFGRPGVSRGGRSAFPQLRLVALMDAATHLMRHAVFGPYRMNELKVALHMLEHIQAGMLLLLDRAYHCYVWPARLIERGAHFVIRAKAGDACVVRTRKLKRLGRNDWMGELLIPKSTKRAQPQLPEKILVRLITRGHRGRRITLITSLLSPTEYPADEIVAVYGQRWEAELGFRELKTYLGEQQVLLRSKRPHRALQEAYGLLIAFNSVRALMCAAAEKCARRPLELSFVGALELVRAAVLAGPGALQNDDLSAAIVRRVLQPKREGRSCPRAVKIKASNYPRKRPSGRATLTRYQRQRRTVHERRAARQAARREKKAC